VAAGYQTDKNTVDARVGNTVIALRNTFDDIRRVKAWFDTQTDAALVAQGWTQAEVTLMKASFTDLVALANVSTGAATQPAANNFFFNASKLTGLS
jgi:hypothetical protein